MDWVCLHLERYSFPRPGGGEPENDDKEKNPHVCGGEWSVPCPEIYMNYPALKTA